MTNVIGEMGDRSFIATVAPTVTAGAYSAGDIMGGLLTFPVQRIPNNPVLITGVLVSCKAALTPNLRLVLFNTGTLTTTNQDDNDAYSLAVADVTSVITVIDLSTETWVDHGTPNTIQKDGLGIVADVASDEVNLYGFLIDDTGVTLTSTSDIQVRIRGLGA